MQESQRGDTPDPLLFPNQPFDVENADDETLAKVVEYHQEQTRFFQEKVRSREKAKGLAMQERAQEELAILKAEREVMKHREREISALEEQARTRYQKGVQLAPQESLPNQCHSAAATCRKPSPSEPFSSPDPESEPEVEIAPPPKRHKTKAAK